ncbi:MAG TPA: hypothetical protein VG095_05535 [Chthoniobacterales bacterium]|nr:hypothetical protein [Chthoniobacterales bacterium]
MDAISIPDHLWVRKDSGFVAPDWDGIAREVQARIGEAERGAAWSEVARQWLQRIRGRLGSPYSLRESANFFLLAVADERKAAEVLSFLEECLRGIRSALFFAADEPLIGKIPVLVFADIDLFYVYLSDYVEEEGEYGGVGGVYLNRGYGHFAVQSLDFSGYIDVLSHELCHAILAPRELPLWLDEAITGTVEHDITGRNPYVLDREIVQRHRSYWTRERLRKFWSGESFWLPDEGQELSYHLARFVLNGLWRGGVTPAADMKEFVRRAKRDDAGFAAAQEVFDVDLEDVVGEFLFGSNE